MSDNTLAALKDALESARHFVVNHGHNPDNHPQARAGSKELLERIDAALEVAVLRVASPVSADYVMVPRETLQKWLDHYRYFTMDGVSKKFTKEMIDMLSSSPAPAGGAPALDAADRAEPGEECHGLDTPERVCFYEQDFYVLSNFSSFEVEWSGFTFKTSEHLYHWLRFTLSTLEGRVIAQQIKDAKSAHDAFKISQANKRHQVEGWDAMKVNLMRDIIRAKATQHEYVRRKLLATGDRLLVENSWRDDFWGWGENRDGQNMLGKLWMEVRSELRAQAEGGSVTDTSGTGCAHCDKGVPIDGYGPGFLHGMHYPTGEDGTGFPCTRKEGR